MSVILRKTNRERRKVRVRGKIRAGCRLPRLSVFRSNKYIYAQIIDDVNGKTLVASTMKEVKEAHAGKNKTEAAAQIGRLVAQKAIKAGINKVVFDRNGYLYAGRVASLAKGAREEGLIF